MSGYLYQVARDCRLVNDIEGNPLKCPSPFQPSDQHLRLMIFSTSAFPLIWTDDFRPRIRPMGDQPNLCHRHESDRQEKVPKQSWIFALGYYICLGHWICKVPKLDWDSGECGRLLITSYLISPSKNVCEFGVGIITIADHVVGNRDTWRGE